MYLVNANNLFRLNPVISVKIPKRTKSERYKVGFARILFATRYRVINNLPIHPFPSKNG